MPAGRAGKQLHHHRETSRAEWPISRSCCPSQISSSRRSATPSSPGVAYELADGLGNKLGDAYQKTIMADCKTSIFTSKLPAVARLIGFANATSHADSDASKYFFANGNA
jgi:hypothetical protein